jgi:hypothetical protein
MQEATMTGGTIALLITFAHVPHKQQEDGAI